MKEARAGRLRRKIVETPARLAAQVGSAVAVPFVTAAGSLVMQVLAARTLGGAGYGVFSVYSGALILLIALHTSWVGDALTVFDRFDPRWRGALWASLPLTLGLGVLIAVVVSITMSRAGAGTTALYVLLVLLALISETTRRIYTVRMEFWSLVANDCVNYGVTLMLVSGLLLSGVEATVGLLLGAWCGGQAAGIALAVLYLPRREFSVVSPRRAAVRQVYGFGFWRSVHAMLRPASTLVSRVMVIGLASAGALGGIEAARLLLSPGVTVVVGVGGYLLAYFARAERGGRASGSGQALRASVVLAVVTLLMSAVAIAAVDLLEPLITGGSFEVDRVALYGWAVWTVTFALTMPMANLATSRKLSRTVSAVRGVESAAGLGALAVVLVLDPGNASYAPFCLGAGGLLSAVVLWLVLRRGDGDAGRRPRSADGLADHEVEVVVPSGDPAERQRADQAG